KPDHLAAVADAQIDDLLGAAVARIAAEHLNAERPQHTQVEIQRALDVGDGEIDVVDRPDRHASPPSTDRTIAGARAVAPRRSFAFGASTAPANSARSARSLRQREREPPLTAGGRANQHSASRA